MDPVAIQELEKAGIDTRFERFTPHVPVRLDDKGAPLALAEEVPVQSGEAVAVVRLKSIGALFTGSRPGPSLNGQPPDEYMPFLAMIEQSAIECCEAAHRVPTDDDFEHLYLHLRRRPDGTHADPLFSYMQAAARLYMSLRDVSRAEFEAIAQRLTRSARHFSFGAGSTNYFDNVGAAFR